MLRLLICGGFLFVFVLAQDCLYNKCTFPPEGNHSPCGGLGDRQLVRSVNCGDGSLWHICCFSHQRADIQKSRQQWFRQVIKYSSHTGPNCMRRILCEQSCKDGLSGTARSDYPEVLGSDGDADTGEAKSYVEAYAAGENLSCYGLVKSPHVVATSADCESRCNETNPLCQSDMSSNLEARGIYGVSRAAHKMGMFAFNVVWWMDDGASYVATTVENKFNQLLRDMRKLEEGFESYLDSKKKTRVGNKSKREATDVEDPEEATLWESFLEEYQQTDGKLVEILLGQVSHPKFLYYVNVTQEIVDEYDFRAEFPSSAGFLAGNYLFLLPTFLALVVKLIAG